MKMTLVLRHPASVSDLEIIILRSEKMFSQIDKIHDSYQVRIC